LLATDRAKGRKLVTQRVQSGIRLGPARRVLERRPVAEPLAQGAASPGIARDPTSPSIPRRVPVVVPGGARIADLGRGSVVEEQGGAPAWRGAAAGGAAAGQDREREEKEDREERHTRLAPNSARSLEGRQAEHARAEGSEVSAAKRTAKKRRRLTLELTLKLTLTPTRTFGLTHSRTLHSPHTHSPPHIILTLTLTLSPPILPPIASSSPLVHQPLPLPQPPSPPPPPPTTSIPSIPRTYHALPLPQIDDGPAIAIVFAFAIPPSHRQRAWNSLLDRCFCPLIDQFRATTSAGHFAGAGLPSQSPSVPASQQTSRASHWIRPKIILR